jgi:hypothetical protein
MAALDRGQILGKRVLGVERVDVPEWNENGAASEVYARIMNVRQRFECLGIMSEERERSPEHPLTPRAIAALFIWGACDANGAQLLGADDLASVYDLDGRPVWRVAQAVLRINALLTTSTEDIAKNSEATPNAGSPSALH